MDDFYKQIFAELEISRHLKIYKWGDPLENLPFPWTKLLGIHQMVCQNLLVKKPWLFGMETRLKLIFFCPSTTWQKVRNHLRFEFQLPYSNPSFIYIWSRGWCIKFATHKWPFYDHFYPNFYHLLTYLLKNWGSDCLTGLNLAGSKVWGFFAFLSDNFWTN